jgi:hypothetical protein
MKGIVRHWGIPVKSLERSISGPQVLGFHGLAFSRETWMMDYYKTGGNGVKCDLTIAKMEDAKHVGLELVEGNWRPHIAVTLIKGDMSEVWDELVGLGWTPLARQDQELVEVVLFNDIDGFMWEIVKQKGGK